MLIERDSFGGMWEDLLFALLGGGQEVSPRGTLCRELCGVQLYLRDARNNLLWCEERKLNYRFAIAEWLWIWFGRSDVKTIARYNPKIAGMASDDGVDFRGAYGPRLQPQWHNAMKLLSVDPDTRQAVIQIFSAYDLSGVTKDVPCTLTLQFLRRNDKLHAILSMRSSDVWLGLPYDVFNFTMLQNVAATHLGLEVGWFKAFLGSSHLYERDAKNASQTLITRAISTLRSPKVEGEPPYWLGNILVDPDKPDVAALSDWPGWSVYAEVLRSCSSQAARIKLQLLSQEVL